MDDRFDDDTKNRNIGKGYWDTLHTSYERERIIYDDWLQLFDRAIANCQTPIIDLGCGSGNDTKYLVERGKKVIPCDYSTQAIENIQKNFPEVEKTHCFDMREGLPFDDDFTSIIIADLSLHYFSDEDTRKILAEIKRVLKKDGILLFRVNSVNDVNHGAGQGEEVERHYYRTDDGRFKRFFDKDDIDSFFDDWEMLYINEEQMTRYEKPKELWRGAYKVNK